MATQRLLVRYFLLIVFLILLPRILIAQPLDTWHWRNPLPQGNTLYGITYGDDTFASVGSNGTIITSTDGVAWERRTSGTYYNLCGVAYGNGTFIAVGYDYDHVSNKYSGIILASPDAITWTTKLLAHPNSLRGVTYSDETFVVVGQKGTILTSPDGETWIVKTSNTYDWLYGIASGDGIFVAVGDNGTILTSSDSSTWDEEISGTPNCLSGIVYGGSSFVTVGNGGTILTSPNGETWTPGTSGTSNDLTGVTYGENTFVAVGVDGIFTSPNGDIWNKQATPLPNDRPEGISFGNSTFVVVENGGIIITSPDGTDWTVRTSGARDDLTGIAHGNGKFVVITDGNSILFSSDGSSWIRKDIFLAGSVYLRSVIFANGLFVVAGSDGSGFGIIATSPDCEDWSIRAYTSTRDRLSSVAYGDDTFVAVGDRGTILTSADGEIWINRSLGWSDKLHISLSGVTYSKGIFVAVGFSTAESESIIITSPDGIQWSRTLGSALGGNYLSGVVFGNNLFVAVGTYTITTSSNGMDWTSHWDASFFQFTSIGFGNGHFVVTGSLGRILTSFGGVKWIERPSECTNWLYGVAFINNTFFVVGEYGSILQSDPLSDPSEKITLLDPNGREAIPSGALYPVSWRAPSQAEKFKLMFYDGLSWSKVGENLTGTTYDWPVPVSNKQGCLLKVIGYDSSGAKVGADTSDGPFTIQTVTLTSPNERGTFNPGDVVPIAWTINETGKPITKVLLYYTKNAGSTWKLIDTLSGSYPPGDYSRDWTVPSVGTIAKTKCKVKVVLKDTKRVTRGNDVSDSYFTIAP